MSRWKDTVSFRDLHPAMVMADRRIESIIANLGYECWITSGNDSTHKLGSKHYKGEALDYRTHDMKSDDKRLITAATKLALGPQFYVELEHVGEEEEHMHVQFNGQPEPTMVTGTLASAGPGE